MQTRGFGWDLGWTFLDPVMGVLGGVVVLKWGVGLCRASGAQLVDATASLPVEDEIRRALESVGDVRVADLHLWEVGPHRRSCVITLVASQPHEAAFYRSRVREVASLAHLTIEVHRCTEGHASSATEA